MMAADGTNSACKLTDIKPTVENVIPYSRYKRTQPEINGVPMVSVPTCDQLLLLGGGRDLVLGLLQHERRGTIEDVELFILNTGLILWFQQLDEGIEIPYESIIYHGSLRTCDTVGHQLALIITLETDPVLCNFFQVPRGPTNCDDYTLNTIELMLRPKYSLYDRHFNAEIESLFTFEDFGVNRGDEMVNNCSQNLALCLEMYCMALSDSETNADTTDAEGVEDDNEASTAAYASFSDTINMLDNSGLADDLGAPLGTLPQQLHY